MSVGNYRPEVVDWVRRTTAAQGVPEHVPGEVFQARLGALFGAGATSGSPRIGGSTSTAPATPVVEGTGLRMPSRV